jgi:hypothetical protein
MATAEEFIQTYSEALLDHNAAVLAGAGMSIPAGLVDWKELMRSIAADIGLDVDKESDLVAVAQYHRNERGGRHRLDQKLVTEFSQRARITENHEILARLPIDTYWTTNYDRVIEDALENEGKRVDVKTTTGNMAITRPRRDVVLYKMHGDVSDPTSAVISKDDYELYNTSSRGELFSTALRGDLVSKTFLFLGFSFSDPNLDYILGRIRVLLGENRREHYCLMRKVKREDFNSDADYQYAQTKQGLQIRDLQRYGIMAVMLDDFTEYTQALRELERRYRVRQIFISGSACTYGPWSKTEAQQLLERLSKRLARDGMDIVSGFGLGVGQYVINGVLTELEREGTRNLCERLALRPFPFAIKNPKERKKRWSQYRQDMIARCGVAIFVFGNKEDTSGRTVDAEGMFEEFEIASKEGLLVVPVGITGYVAAALHMKVSSDFRNYYPEVRGLREAFDELTKPGSPNDVVGRILEFIGLATGRR